MKKLFLVSVVLFTAVTLFTGHTKEKMPGEETSNVKQLSAGNYHSFFLKEDDTVWSTGRNDGVQLGGRHLYFPKQRFKKLWMM